MKQLSDFSSVIYFLENSDHHLKCSEVSLTKYLQIRQLFLQDAYTKTVIYSLEKRGGGSWKGRLGCTRVIFDRNVQPSI